MTSCAHLQTRSRFIAGVYLAVLGCSSSDPGTLLTIGSGGNSSSLGGINAGGNAGTGAPGAGGVTGTGGSTITVGTPPSGGAGGVEGCVGTSSTATPLPPILGFLIDTSWSMNDPPMGSTTSKWVSTRDALTKAFTDMVDGTGTGLLYYPNVSTSGGGPAPGRGRGGAPGSAGGASSSGGATTGGSTNSTCINRQVAVPIAGLDAAQRMRILTSLQGKSPSGNTPTHDAYKFALETVEASTLTGSKFVVLVTDGSPTFAQNCVGDGLTAVEFAPIIEEATRAAQRGIKTFVIGSPGSEAARTSLSQMAVQGGTAQPNCSDMGPTYCHFDMTSAPDLSAALNAAFKAITGQVVNCNYNIPAVSGTNVLDLSRVNVNYTNGSGEIKAVPRDPSTSDCNQGWQFSSDQKQIQLCPDMCNTVKSDNGAKVDVVFGCKTITL